MLALVYPFILVSGVFYYLLLFPRFIEMIPSLAIKTGFLAEIRESHFNFSE